MECNLRGTILYYDSIKNKATIQFSWMTPEKQNIIERLKNNGDDIVFKVKKSERRMKENHQLKYYYRCLKKILMKVGVDPTGKNMDSFDYEIKKSLWGADLIKIGNKEIPFVKGKKNASKEEMDDLIDRVKDTYSELNIDWDSEL